MQFNKIQKSDHLVPDHHPDQRVPVRTTKEGMIFLHGTSWRDMFKCCGVDVSRASVASTSSEKVISDFFTYNLSQDTTPKVFKSSLMTELSVQSIRQQLFTKYVFTQKALGHSVGCGLQHNHHRWYPPYNESWWTFCFYIRIVDF